ncbi:PspC domain-containing protein [Rheinheimera maricola]|uniref:PspC domain-containing protein n=1 Tax=Rheinheimera maricola TaxID=2793282 RepID=A0ABS7X6K0_9GAMM|nr:PspC domain-containing protein [Rheinheimera maricola]MBZ9611167.1 PspC domain-containing protein [Rheinheimera maricola]
MATANTNSNHHNERWYCARAQRKVAGVCAGLAQYYKQPRWIIRLLAAVMLLMFPLAIIAAYFVAAVVLPDR